MPWRVFPWDPGAKLGEPFSPSYIHPSQGSGRFDLAGKLVVYLAETAVHAVAEKLQRFRGQKIDRKDLIESGKTLALVECTLGKLKLADLCDPAMLVKHGIKPDVLASRDFAKTQAVAAALYKEGFSGLRWWSALSGDWHTIVVFQGAIEYAKPEQLTIGHKVVQEASVALGIQGFALTRA
jgi:RES domain-containing protein